MKKLTALVLVPPALAVVGFAVVAWALRELDSLIAPDMFDIEEDFDDYDREPVPQCPDVVCIDGIDGWTPDMLRKRSLDDVTVNEWTAASNAYYASKRHWQDPMHD